MRKAKGRVRRPDGKRILITGNEACGEGAVQAGLRFYAGYPITPQNELTAYMSRRMLDVGGTFIQAESELAAISMVFGATVAGVRAMTSSSSPGISLKQEGISYLAACELPAVIVNIMRGGPGLGNIAPSQSDYFQATKGGGHGDYHMVVLAPASCQEMLDFTRELFDIADRYRGPVMVLGDGILGQMMEPVIVDRRSSIDVRRESQTTNDKRQTTKSWALTGCKGRKPNVIKSLRLKEGELEAFNEKLEKKYDLIRKREIRFEKYRTEGAKIIIVAYGTSSRIGRASVDRLRKYGIKAGLFRPISLWPFPYEALKKLDKGNTKFLTVEMSAGQMLEDVRLAIEDKSRVHFYGRTGGGIPSEEAIVREAISYKL
ncbi:MAG: 3-methyl-2-oxobutanoate dehydrogenase subunit VorB [Omnitrophica bacterium]|nr:3-methyl-2-oxobutanoate dehydrogenase subunit VorB [Candidatus Omnitrophota bacterium]